LRDLGYVEGRNLIIDARWGEGSARPLNVGPFDGQECVRQQDSFARLKAATNQP